MTDPIVRVGTVGYPTAKKKVTSAVDVIELTEARQGPPGRPVARKWRAETPGHVSFTAQLPRQFVEPAAANCSLPGDRRGYGNFQCSEENLALWKKTLDFAAAVDARALVLDTPPTVTPAPEVLRRMEKFLGSVDRDGRLLVWEPHGPWEAELASAFATDNNLILALDPLRDDPPPGEVAYFRLGPFAAMGSRMGVYDLERLAGFAAGYTEVYYLFETHRSLDDARNLKLVLSEEGLEEEY